MFYGIVASVVLLDQLTKFLALTFLASQDTFPVIPGALYFSLVHNTGIAFGLLREHESILLALITLSLLFLSFWGARLKNSIPAVRWGFALILGGAIGNWIDRLRFGAVIDFIDLRVWPVFNVADSAITIGVGIYLIFLVREKT